MDHKLETFLAVCKTMHYGRAAEILNLSQPAVSKHIQSLEAEYGVSLFEYSARRLRKTRCAEILEEYASSLKYNEEELILKLHDKPKPQLRIGATKSIGDYILLPEICRFLNNPDNKLRMTVDNTANLLELLDLGRLDFVILEGIFDKSKYDWFLMRREPYIGICPASHRFSGREVPTEELFNERLILREEGSGTRRILEDELLQQGYTVKSFSDCVYISSFTLIKGLVSAGCGISFLYEAVVGDDPEFGHFSSPPLTGTHDLNVVFLKNTHAGLEARRFLY